jgi:dipeptidyl aminopeptidase/acylaminoacyl peptidase
VVVAAACSPDGSTLAALYEADGRLRLMLLPAAGEAGSDRTPPRVALGKAFSWSPDGREIVVSARELTTPPNRHALLAIPAAGGTARTLFAQLGEIDWPRCAPDGTIYFLRRTTQGLVLAATSLAASAPKDLLPAWRYEVSGDGNWLACVAETAPGLDTLYVVSAAEARSGLGGAVEVAHGRAGSVAWSSDGGLLAYTLGPAGGSGEAEAEADLFLAARDLGFRQRVTSGVGVSAVHFDPSGRFLAFACHPGSWQPSAPGSVLAVLELR